MKLATQYITPMQVVFWRVLISVLVVGSVALARRAIKPKHLRYWYHFLVMSILATVVYYYCFVVGSHLLYSGIAGAVSGSAPIFTFILGILFLGEEKISVQKIVGLILGMTGIILLAKPFEGTFSPTTWQGIGYMVAGSLSFGASFIYAKKFIMPLQIPSAALALYQLFGASLILLAITDFDGTGNILQDNTALVGLVVGLGILGTGLAFLIYYYIIEKMGAIKASSVTYIPPIVALGVGATWAREPIGVMDVVATLIILVGVYLLKK